MAAIARKLQKLFAASLTPTGNVAQWGSLQADAVVYSNDPDVIQALAGWEAGLNGAVVGNRSPAQEDLNGLFLVLAQQIAYVLQRGLPEWLATETYWLNCFCSVGDQVYVSLSNGNLNNNPAVDTNNWAPWGSKAKGTRVAAASVVFDGINASSGNARIISSDNVASVTKNAAGSYTVVFAVALPSANYVVQGTCGSEDGQPYGAGDDGVIVGNIAGQGNAIRSAAQCRIFTINPTDKALVQSGCVSLTFFALP